MFLSHDSNRVYIQGTYTHKITPMPGVHNSMFTKREEALLFFSASTGRAGDAGRAVDKSNVTSLDTEG